MQIYLTEHEPVSRSTVPQPIDFECRTVHAVLNRAVRDGFAPSTHAFVQSLLG